eukprot:8176835-Pyramimonas_sp.AAC.1
MSKYGQADFDRKDIYIYTYAGLELLAKGKHSGGTLLTTCKVKAHQDLKVLAPGSRDKYLAAGNDAADSLAEAAAGKAG